MESHLKGRQQIHLKKQTADESTCVVMIFTWPTAPGAAVGGWGAAPAWGAHGALHIDRSQVLGVDDQS